MALPVSVSDITGAIKSVRDLYKKRQFKRTDDAVLRVLSDNERWAATPRPCTGGGDLAVRAQEIADVLSLPLDDVADSLERLESAGKARQHGGTLSNPAPYWTVVRR
jgi:hypothetical protein